MNAISGWRAIAERIAPTLPHRSVRIISTPFTSTYRTAHCLSSRTFTSLTTPSNNSNTLSDNLPSLKSSSNLSASQSTSPSSDAELSGSSHTTQPTTSSTYIEPYLDPSISTLLPLLRAQSPYYAQIHIQGHPYLITPGDSVRLPFVLQDVQVGDIIRLNRATVFGSRDYTLKASATARGEKQQFLDERLFVARATVINVVFEPLRVKVKKEPRNRHARHFFSKHSYTVLRISELRPASEEEWKEIQQDKHKTIDGTSS